MNKGYKMDFVAGHHPLEVIRLLNQDDGHDWESKKLCLTHLREHDGKSLRKPAKDTEVTKEMADTDRRYN